MERRFSTPACSHMVSAATHLKPVASLSHKQASQAGIRAYKHCSSCCMCAHACKSVRWVQVCCSMMPSHLLLTCHAKTAALRCRLRLTRSLISSPHLLPAHASRLWAAPAVCATRWLRSGPARRKLHALCATRLAAWRLCGRYKPGGRAAWTSCACCTSESEGSLLC